MVKVEKKRKFKTEYIPIYISSIILILFLCLLILTINYEGKSEDDVAFNKPNAVNEDLSITKTETTCSQEELNELLNLANGISGDYQTAFKEVPIEYTEEDALYYESLNGVEKYRYLEVTIKGLKEGIYIEISNDYNDDVITVRTSDLNEKGEFRFETPDMDVKTNFVVSIYADKYACAKEILRKVGFETKIYNSFSVRTGCIMYPNYENCAELVDELITPDEFLSGLEKYKKNHKEYEKQAQANLINAFSESAKFSADDIDDNGNIKESSSSIKKIAKKFDENKELIIISFIIIGIGVLIVVLIMFVRRNKL